MPMLCPSKWQPWWFCPWTTIAARCSPVWLLVNIHISPRILSSTIRANIWHIKENNHKEMHQRKTTTTNKMPYVRCLCCYYITKNCTHKGWMFVLFIISRLNIVFNTISITHAHTRAHYHQSINTTNTPAYYAATDTCRARFDSNVDPCACVCRLRLCCCSVVRACVRASVRFVCWCVRAQKRAHIFVNRQLQRNDNHQQQHTRVLYT